MMLVWKRMDDNPMFSTKKALLGSFQKPLYASDLLVG